MITPRHLRNTYLAVGLEVEVEPGRWVDAADAAATVDMPAFVLTAWNPIGQHLDPTENLERNGALRRAIEELPDAAVRSALGFNRQRTWTEESFLVTGISRRAALSLGRRFDQHAIFELTRTHLRVLGCAGHWDIERPLNQIDWQPPLESQDTLGEAIHRSLGVSVSTRMRRADQRGWVHEDNCGLSCSSCDAPLEAFGCDLTARDGTPYRAAVVMCPREHLLTWPADMQDAERDVIETRRQYLLARDDADQLAKANPTYHCYVIELQDTTARDERPTPWVYVGQTSKSPSERFQEHLDGVRSNTKARRFGVRLRPDLDPDQPPLRTREEATTYEAWRAASWRARGWRVEGGT